MPNRSRVLLALAVLSASCVAALPAGAIPLLGVEAESGTLHRISRADAWITAIGSTGLAFHADPARVLADLERARRAERAHASRAQSSTRGISTRSTTWVHA